MNISVVIPTCNKATYLSLTLTSLFHQSYEKSQYEVIVVQDGEQDGTEEIVAHFSAQAWNFRVIQSQKYSRGATRNIGIKASQGDVVILTDDDCICNRNFIAAHAHHHVEANSKAVIGARRGLFTRIPVKHSFILDALKETMRSMNSYIARETQERIIAALPGTLDIVSNDDILNNFERIERLSIPEFTTPFHLSRIADGKHSCPWHFFLTSNASVRREVLLQSGLFDEAFQGWGEEDIELGYRLFRAGIAFDAAIDATIYHQIHPFLSHGKYKEWLHNYIYFAEKYQTPEIYLRWKVSQHVITISQYEALVKNIRAGKLSTSEEERIKEQYQHFIASKSKEQLDERVQFT